MWLFSEKIKNIRETGFTRILTVPGHLFNRLDIFLFYNFGNIFGKSMIYQFVLNFQYRVI